ncbi:MAG: hypothetical protein KY464_14075 [Gemmatimonadetes bacterium]|nr:hypothetical protein [Gemmatimonadota bacterium]
MAGIVCGWHVLRLTFAGSSEERAATVRWWGYFRGPLGAWTCVWGAIAMLTSAPLDDWWHQAYGLDVKILSPPHAVLAQGILAIQLGALFMVLAAQNRQHARRTGTADVGADGAGPAERLLPWMAAFAASLVLANFAIMVSEYTWRVFQHGPLFYQVVCGAFLLPLVAGAIASRLRWSAIAVAGLYMAFFLVLVWILPLFPAEPKLGPVLSHVDRMVPPQYPLLLIVPAAAIDVVLHRWNRTRGWGLAAVLSAVFLVTFITVQWPFSIFLNSPLAHNAFFAQHLLPYMVGSDWALARGEFIGLTSGLGLARGLVIALIIGVVSARLGLAAGGWMSRVHR